MHVLLLFLCIVSCIGASVSCPISVTLPRIYQQGPSYVRNTVKDDLTTPVYKVHGVPDTYFFAYEFTGHIRVHKWVYPALNVTSYECVDCDLTDLRSIHEKVRLNQLTSVVESVYIESNQTDVDECPPEDTYFDGCVVNQDSFPGSSTCTACPNGFERASSAPICTKVLVCETSEYIENGVCKVNQNFTKGVNGSALVDCPLHHDSSRSGGITCQPCENNTKRAEGEVQCSACRDSTQLMYPEDFSVLVNNVCTDCLDEKTVSNAGGSCETCGNGQGVRLYKRYPELFCLASQPSVENSSGVYVTQHNGHVIIKKLWNKTHTECRSICSGDPRCQAFIPAQGISIQTSTWNYIPECYIIRTIPNLPTCRDTGTYGVWAGNTGEIRTNQYFEGTAGVDCWTNSQPIGCDFQTIEQWNHSGALGQKSQEEMNYNVLIVRNAAQLAVTYKKQIHCVDCIPGTFSTYNTSASLDMECTVCPIGQYQNEYKQASCKTCPAGKTTLQTGSVNAGACVHTPESSTTCADGFYNRSRDSACTRCDATEYVTEDKPHLCTACPSGYMTGVSPFECNVSIAVTCGVNKHLQNGVCEECPSHTFSKHGHASCTPCPDEPATHPTDISEDVDAYCVQWENNTLSNLNIKNKHIYRGSMAGANITDVDFSGTELYDVVLTNVVGRVYRCPARLPETYTCLNNFIVGPDIPTVVEAISPPARNWRHVRDCPAFAQGKNIYMCDENYVLGPGGEPSELVFETTSNFSGVHLGRCVDDIPSMDIYCRNNILFGPPEYELIARVSADTLTMDMSHLRTSTALTEDVAYDMRQWNLRDIIYDSNSCDSWQLPPTFACVNDVLLGETISFASPIVFTNFPLNALDMTFLDTVSIATMENKYMRSVTMDNAVDISNMRYSSINDCDITGDLTLGSVYNSTIRDSRIANIHVTNTVDQFSIMHSIVGDIVFEKSAVLTITNSTVQGTIRSTEIGLHTDRVHIMGRLFAHTLTIGSTLRESTFDGMVSIDSDVYDVNLRDSSFDVLQASLYGANTILQNTYIKNAYASYEDSSMANCPDDIKKVFQCTDNIYDQHVYYAFNSGVECCSNLHIDLARLNDFVDQGTRTFVNVTFGRVLGNAIALRNVNLESTMRVLFSPLQTQYILFAPNADLTGVKIRFTDTVYDLSSVSLAGATLTSSQIVFHKNTTCPQLPAGYVCVTNDYFKYILGKDVDMESLSVENMALAGVDISNAALKYVFGTVASCPAALPDNYICNVDKLIIGPYVVLEGKNITNYGSGWLGPFTSCPDSGPLTCVNGIVDGYVNDYVWENMNLTNVDISAFKMDRIGYVYGKALNCPATLSPLHKCIDGYIVGPSVGLENVNVTGYNFSDISLDGARLDGMFGVLQECPNVGNGYACIDKRIAGNGASLTGISFEGKNIANIDFSSYGMVSNNFSHSHGEVAACFPARSNLEATWSCINSRVIGPHTSFTDVNLTLETDIYDMDLTGAYGRVSACPNGGERNGKGCVQRVLLGPGVYPSTYTFTGETYDRFLDLQGADLSRVNMSQIALTNSRGLLAACPTEVHSSQRCIGNYIIGNGATGWGYKTISFPYNISGITLTKMRIPTDATLENVTLVDVINDQLHSSGRRLMTSFTGYGTIKHCTLENCYPTTKENLYMLINDGATVSEIVVDAEPRRLVNTRCSDKGGYYRVQFHSTDVQWSDFRDCYMNNVWGSVVGNAQWPDTCHTHGNDVVCKYAKVTRPLTFIPSVSVRLEAGLNVDVSDQHLRHIKYMGNVDGITGVPASCPQEVPEHITCDTVHGFTSTRRRRLSTTPETFWNTYPDGSPTRITASGYRSFELTNGKYGMLGPNMDIQDVTIQTTENVNWNAAGTTIKHATIVSTGPMTIQNVNRLWVQTDVDAAPLTLTGCSDALYPLSSGCGLPFRCHEGALLQHDTIADSDTIGCFRGLNVSHLVAPHIHGDMTGAVLPSNASSMTYEDTIFGTLAECPSTLPSGIRCHNGILVAESAPLTGVRLDGMDMDGFHARASWYGVSGRLASCPSTLPDGWACTPDKLLVGPGIDFSRFGEELDIGVVSNVELRDSIFAWTQKINVRGVALSCPGRLPNFYTCARGALFGPYLDISDGSFGHIHFDDVNMLRGVKGQAAVCPTWTGEQNMVFCDEGRLLGPGVDLTGSDLRRIIELEERLEDFRLDYATYEDMYLVPEAANVKECERMEKVIEISCTVGTC